ncbi:cytochrome P450 [Roseicyclus sp.]|uniref:cytochrome P450 n=1 Tax=Roseicyclus sp. TaxID=1914329 RepID=UPI003F9F09E8
MPTHHVRSEMPRAMLANLPRDTSPDATLSLLREGYAFISNRCERLGRDGFLTRIMLRRAICLRGEAAMRLLYGTEGLTRVGAMPSSVLHLLQDEGSVQQLEGEAHRVRKAVFVRLLVTSHADRTLAADFSDDWRARLLARGHTEVLRSASDSLARIACRWAGLPERFADNPGFRRALYRMSADAGSFGPATATALARRRQMETCLTEEVQRTRAEGADGDSPLGELLRARNADGTQLDDASVVVELLNLLRPIVAVGRYIAFATAVLVREPRWRARLADAAALRGFCEEVRRISPFFPFTAARVTKPQNFEGLGLAPGDWVLADLWGTLHDPRLFPDPHAFRPDRDLDWARQDHRFVPQGGGAVETTHRCPGEKVTLALMEAALRVLTRDLDWEAPGQNLSARLDRIPSRPESGVRLTAIARRQ